MFLSIVVLAKVAFSAKVHNSTPAPWIAAYTMDMLRTQPMHALRAGIQL